MQRAIRRRSRREEIVNVVIHWWVWPAGLIGAAAILWYHGSRESGMLGGVVQFLIGCGLIIGAIVAVIVRLWP